MCKVEQYYIGKPYFTKCGAKLYKKRGDNVSNQKFLQYQQNFCWINKLAFS